MNKYSVKLILFKHKENKQGQHPIYLRITINRKTSYISTGLFISEKQWDAKRELVKDGHPMATVYNPDITHRKHTLVRSLIDTHLKGETLSALDLKLRFSRSPMNNVFEFMERFSAEVKYKRKPGTLENYRKHLLRLELFHGSRGLSFEEINPDYLSRYENHLRETVGPNYTHALFKTLKTFFNAARKKGVTNNYPFSKYENPIYRAPIKDYLTLKELAKWEDFADATTDPILKQVAIYFLLGCYTGLRISDWFSFDVNRHIVDGRLSLQAKKNGELVVMPVNKPLARNIERIRCTDLTLQEPTINKELKTVAASLNINKHITSHTGRHTFAITICAEQGMSSETCATLMGITNETCVENYYRITTIKILTETTKAWKSLE